MKRLPIFLITLALLLTAIPVSPIETAQSDALYIQYYSPLHDTFIIERADGTDSRLFGKKWIDEDARGMTNGAWSPSGEWYAFISTKYVDGWLRGQDVVVSDISDTRTLTVLQQIEHEPDFVQWFEEDDVLLVSTLKGFPSDYPFERYFYVIDAATDSMLATFMLRPQEPWDCCIEWSNAFQSFIIRFDNPQEQIEYIYLVDANGVVREPEQSDGFFYEIAPSGWMVVNNSGIKFLENIFTRERIHAVVPFSSVRFYEHFAVLRDCILPGDDCLLNLQSQELIPVPSGFNVMFGDEPIIRNESRIIVWNDEFEVFLMDIATRAITPTGVVALPGFLFLPPPDWDLPPVHWDENAGLVIWEQVPETITIVKDDESKTITFPFDLSYSALKLSSDGQWIGNVSTGANTYNIKEEVAYSHQPHSRSVLSIPGGDIIWHPEQNWLIARQVSYIAGGDDKFRWLNVASADGSFNRELPFMCANYETGCIDWLPERVDIDRLPEGRPESNLEQPEIPPAIEIYHGEFVNDINWSENGQYLQAAYTDASDATFISVSDAEVIDELPAGTDMIKECPNCISQESRDFFLRPTENSIMEVMDTSTDSVVLELYAYGQPLTEVTPDHQYLFHVNYHGSLLQLWDLHTGELVYELPRGVSVFAISPDGRKLAAGVSWEVWIWDIEDLVGGE